MAERSEAASSGVFSIGYTPLRDLHRGRDRRPYARGRSPLGVAGRAARQPAGPAVSTRCSIAGLRTGPGALRGRKLPRRCTCKRPWPREQRGSIWQIAGERDRPARRGHWPYAGGLQALITPPGAAPEPEVAGFASSRACLEVPCRAVVRRLRRLVRDVVERAGRAKRSASRTRVRCRRPRASRCRWSGSGRGRGPRGTR